MTPGAGPRLAVVAVLYRSAAMLARTLPTWADSARGLPVEFVFVDNFPDDGCQKIIAGCLDGHTHRYLPDAGNAGFAAGCNRAAATVTAPHLLLLNPDVWLRGDSLRRILTAAAQAPDTPVAVGLNMHGGEFRGIRPHPISLFIDRPATWRHAPVGPHAWGHSVQGDGDLSRLRAFLLARNRILVAARTLTTPLLLVALPVLVVAHCGLAARRITQGTLGPFLRGVWRGLLAAPAARRTWRGARFGLASLKRYTQERNSGG